MIQHIEESHVFLTKHLAQQDRHIFYLLEGLRTEEIRRVVIGFQQCLILWGNHWRQLLQIANHQQLHPAKRFVMITISSQHGVDGIEQIASYHRDLVDNQQVERGDDTSFLLAEIKLALNARIGHVWRKRQLKERVDGHTARIDGGYTSRRYNNRSFLTLFNNSLQKGGLACASLTCQEDTSSRVLYEIPRSAQFIICFCFHSS